LLLFERGNHQTNQINFGNLHRIFRKEKYRMLLKTTPYN
jgi:hypothetical protein